MREGVTNVVRHSGATRCRIRVTASQIEISERRRLRPRGPAQPKRNGGRAGRPSPAKPAHLKVALAARVHRQASGHGLAGLRERAALAGATVSVGRSASGRFALRVHVP